MSDDFSDVIALIQEAQPTRPYLVGRWGGLLGALLLDSARGIPRRPAVAQLHNITNDLNSLLTLTLRVDHQDRAMRDGALAKGLWLQFIGCDVEFYHVAFRSLFDHVAILLGQFAGQPGTVPPSFEAIRNWLGANEGNRARLGPDLAALVDNCTWFSDIRLVRDCLVHEGGMPVIFDVTGRPFFQVYQGFRPVVSFPAHTIENDLIDLKPYMALTMARLLRFLESIEPAITSRVSLPNLTHETMHFHPAYALVRQWLTDLVTRP